MDKIAVGLIALVAGVPALAATHTVSTSGLAFDPVDVTIDVGETVLWDIGSTHNVVQTDGPGSCTRLPGGFLSGASESDLSVRLYERMFDSAGVYYYKCNSHCSFGMRGTVTVLPASDGGSASDGQPGGDAGTAGDPSLGGDPAPTGDSPALGDSDGIERGGNDDGGGCSAAKSQAMALVVVPLVWMAARRQRHRPPPA